MCLVIMFAFLGTGPLLSARDFTSKLSKIFIRCQLLNDVHQIDCRVVSGRLSPGVAEVSLIVQFLHMLHRLLWRNSELLRDQFLGLHCVEREWPMPQPLLFINLGNLRFWVFLHFLEKDKAAKFIIYLVPVPLKRGVFSSLLAFVLHVNVPEVLFLKIFNHLVSLNDEAEGWKLARTVTYDALLVDSVPQ